MSTEVAFIVQSLVTVVLVSVVGVAVLYGARWIGVGRPTGALHLVARLPLDARRTVYLVRVARQVYVLGGSEAGLHKLGEVSESEFEANAAPELPSFSQVLLQTLRRRESSKK